LVESVLWFTALYIVFFFNTPSPSDIYTLSLHDALPIFLNCRLQTSTRLNECFRLRHYLRTKLLYVYEESTTYVRTFENCRTKIVGCVVDVGVVERSWYVS